MVKNDSIPTGTTVNTKISYLSKLARYGSRGYRWI
jgi:hypothetical protein